MKKIRSNIEALECSQHYNQFFRHARADNSGVGGGIWPKFKLIQAFMHVLLTCKTEVDQIKKELECSQDVSHYKSMGIFSRRSMAANSAVLGPIGIVAKHKIIIQYMDI